MSEKMSKTNVSADYLATRLDQVTMSDYERIHAKASLARAEAVAELLVRMTGSVKRLFRTVLLRPFRRLTSALG